MALTQMQQIQSLGEALAWLEREIGWGVTPSALQHLCGRIGELYACVLTNGQMAMEPQQRGYDVVASTGERVSVKTTTQRLPAHVQFNERTFADVDRVMVFRINTDEMQVETVFDASVEAARAAMSGGNGKKFSLSVRSAATSNGAAPSSREVRNASFDAHRIAEFDNGSIRVWTMGEPVEPVKPVLRKIAASLGVETRNSRGNEFNTRQLGTHVLDHLSERWGHIPYVPEPFSPSNFIG